MNIRSIITTMDSGYVNHENACFEDIPRIMVLELKHYKQRFNWDCGVSCVLMTLSLDKREDFLNNFNEVCFQEDFNKSTWTIDLCYLLKRYAVQHALCTVTLGIHPEHHRQSFYARVLYKDEKRVTRRFEEAADYGIIVRNTSLTLQDLVRHLARSGPVILLTNASLLVCDTCKGNKLGAELRSCFPWGTSYNGHYVVLCGYNLPKKKFFYRNPTYKDRVCCMSFKALDEARLSYGTDEDAILVYSKSYLS